VQSFECAASIAALDLNTRHGHGKFRLTSPSAQTVTQQLFRLGILLFFHQNTRQCLARSA